MPIMHSRDLVNWELIGHALDRVYPEKHFRTPQHMKGVWAPCILCHHDGEFYIYRGDPDFGIYMVKAKDPRGPWELPVLVKEGRGAGLIDPSPLWDDDGRAYLAHAFAGSRAGIKSLLVVQEMKLDGTAVIGQPALVFDGHDGHRTVEGPKFYKRGGMYYILAPAGGVTEGWQLALRSKNVIGPYEAQVVMHQGTTDINGPHQGGLVELDSGESWFTHFQDLGPYGRVYT
ncbi:MAG: glycoside hydrolase 43 family protein [Candidatus Synoicihabitans palmerolidicus]|nr:glycoside hydrolase 43 family protein [Candidatus Synoicihabitans palmerolidicus]